MKDYLSQISAPPLTTSKVKKPKELKEAPLEVQLSGELAESMRLLKPEGNLFRDRYRSFVERGIVEPRFRPATKGRKYPLKYVERFSYKHWGK
jgi:nucleolar protein 53